MCEGDSNYKQLNLLTLLEVDQLPTVVQKADGHMFSAEFLLLENGEVNAHSQEFPFLRGIHDGYVDKDIEFLMFLSGFTIAVIVYLNSFHLFDSHSRNGPGSVILQGKFFRFARHVTVHSSDIFTRKKPKSCLLSNAVCSRKH